MINISNAFGSIIKPTNRFLAAARDAAALALNLSPAAKAYFVQMKYKPMPRYTSGVVVDPNTLEPGNAEGRLTRQLSAITTANSRISPVGTQFIQPRVRASSGETVLLDEVLGIGWSLLIWGAIPEEVFEGSELEVLARIGARAVTLRPTTQALVRPTAVPGAQVVADVDGVAKRWFDDRPTPVLFLRPDRFIAAAALVQEAPLALAALTRAMYPGPPQRLGGSDTRSANIYRMRLSRDRSSLYETSGLTSAGLGSPRGSSRPAVTKHVH